MAEPEGCVIEVTGSIPHLLRSHEEILTSVECADGKWLLLEPALDCCPSTLAHRAIRISLVTHHHL